MASWTPDHSMLLSLLLDTVVGTKETIAIRQDFCSLKDCLYSAHARRNIYFTGSKAEGLNLPGSDEDFMMDHNDVDKIKVSQSLDENHNTSAYSIFFMSTDNVPPGFALLQHLHHTPMGSRPYQAFQNMYGIQYLSSDLIVQNIVSEYRNHQRYNWYRDRGHQQKFGFHT